MGGLAGFAFGGTTSFGAMAHHIPEGGSCLIVYGPHVGIDADGVVGKVNRRGREMSGACCGSAAAAAAYVASVHTGTRKPCGTPTDCLDAQQNYVGNLLLTHAERLANSSNAAVELPFALFDAQTELMKKIVKAACGEVAGDGKIALLGGIQINTPDGTSDYFLPLSFEIRDNQSDLVVNLMKLIDWNRVTGQLTPSISTSKGGITTEKLAVVACRAVSEEIMTMVITLIVLLGALMAGSLR